MNKEEKQLLLIDLCARLLYCTWVSVDYEDEYNVHEVLNVCHITGFDDGLINIKPYLRPMSSMTEEEWIEFCDCSIKDEMDYVMIGDGIKFTPIHNRENWLNKKHFDYRGLIPMGLALEAPEGMYNIKTE